MKYYLIITLLFSLAVITVNESCGQVVNTKKRAALKKKGNQKQKEFVVTGKVTQAFSYCGGAAPPEELIEKLATPVAYPGKKFYIRQGNTNNENNRVITSFTSDREGNFTLSLVPGVYSIILEEQLSKLKPADYAKPGLEVDEQCLQKWWVKPYKILEVKNEPVKNLIFHFHHRCFIDFDLPCLNYIGPSPS